MTAVESGDGVELVRVAGRLDEVHAVVDRSVEALRASSSVEVRPCMNVCDSPNVMVRSDGTLTSRARLPSSFLHSAGM